MTLDRRAFGTRALAPELPRDCDLQNSRLDESGTWSGLLCWWSDSENILQRRRMNAVVGSRGWTPSIEELSSDAAAAWVTSEWPCAMVLRAFEKSTFCLVGVCKNEFMRLLWLMTLPLRRMMCWCGGGFRCVWCLLESALAMWCPKSFGIKLVKRWTSNLVEIQPHYGIFQSSQSQSIESDNASIARTFHRSDGRSKHGSNT